MSTLLLTRSEVERLLPLADCVEAVEDGFRALADGRALGPVVAGLHTGSGGFHLKAAGLKGEAAYFAAKLNANFPDNPMRAGLPTIQGLVLLCDAAVGSPVGVFDSMAITALRTAAATAVAARLLARSDANVATIVGCGVQGRAQLRAIHLVRPLVRAYAYDVEDTRAQRFAADMGSELGIEVSPTTDLSHGLRSSLICVTCTPSTVPLLHPGDIVRGAFIAAVGADSELKVEVAPALMAASRVVPDLLEQALKIGDLHHAVAGGRMVASDIHAELAPMVAGRLPGRTDEDQIFVFDSTGTAVQDLAAAILLYRRAIEAGAGRTIEFAA